MSEGVDAGAPRRHKSETAQEAAARRERFNQALANQPVLTPAEVAANRRQVMTEGTDTGDALLARQRLYNAAAARKFENPNPRLTAAEAGERMGRRVAETMFSPESQAMITGFLDSAPMTERFGGQSEPLEVRRDEMLREIDRLGSGMCSEYMTELMAYGATAGLRGGLDARETVDENGAWIMLWTEKFRLLQMGRARLINSEVPEWGERRAYQGEQAVYDTGYTMGWMKELAVYPLPAGANRRDRAWFVPPGEREVAEIRRGRLLKAHDAGKGTGKNWAEEYFGDADVINYARQIRQIRDVQAQRQTLTGRAKDGLRSWLQTTPPIEMQVESDGGEDGAESVAVTKLGYVDRSKQWAADKLAGALMPAEARTDEERLAEAQAILDEAVRVYAEGRGLNNTREPGVWKELKRQLSPLAYKAFVVWMAERGNLLRLDETSNDDRIELVLKRIGGIVRLEDFARENWFVAGMAQGLYAGEVQTVIVGFNEGWNEVKVLHEQNQRLQPATQVVSA